MEEKIAPVIVIIILIPSFSAYTVFSVGGSVSASDPAGDVYIFNADIGEAAGVDIVDISIVYDEERKILAYNVELAGTPKRSGVYSYDIVLEINQTIRYEAIIVITNGAFSLTYFILEGHPLGVLNVDRINATVNDSMLEIEVPLSNEFSPFNTDVLGEAVEYWIMANTRYTSSTGGVAGDEMLVLIPIGEGEGETITYTSTETPVEPGGVSDNETMIIFKDLNARVEGVDVSINEAPRIKFMLVEPSSMPGMKIAILNVTVEGVSKGASHVAIAIEAFSGEKLLSQYIVNSATMGQQDLDGVENGYQMRFRPPQPQGIYAIDIREELVPLKGWSTWRFTASYKVPVGPETVSELQFIKFIEEMEKRNVEVYITAIAFSGLDENQYSTVTKKAEITYSLEGAAEAPSTTANEGTRVGATTTSPITTGAKTAGVGIPGAGGVASTPTTTTTSEERVAMDEEGDSGVSMTLVAVAATIAIVALGAAIMLLRR